MANANPIKGEQDKEIGAFFAPLSVSPQQVPNMTVAIRAGSYWTAGGGIVEFPGGNSPLFTAPPSSARWTLVVLNSFGSIQLINGVVSPTPTIPIPPQGALPLAAVYLTSTTSQITSSLINDVRPFARIVDSVPDLQGELNDRPTFTDMNNAINAAISGGAVLSVNSFTGNVVLTAADVGAAAAGDNVSIFNNDAGYQNAAAVSATVATALTNYAPLTAANTFLDTLTVQNPGNQPIAMVSNDPGSSGLLVDRGVNPAARFEWDESLTTWLIGTTGSMQTVLTNAVVSGKMDKVLPAPTVGNLAVFGAAGQVVDGGPVLMAPVTSVNTFTGAVVLTAADVGAATAAQGALAATALQPADIGVTVEAFDATILKSADIGVTVEAFDATILKSADIGVTVEAFDATILKSADIGVTVQAQLGYTAADDAVVVKSVNSVFPVAGAVTLTNTDVGAAATVHTHVLANVTDVTASAADVNQLTGVVIVPSTRNVNTTGGELTGGGSLSADLTLGLATASAGFAGVFGAVTVDTFGRTTNVVAATAGDINTALGYAAADDAAVVKLTGNQTVAGTKTFTSAPVFPVVSKASLTLGVGNAAVATGTTVLVSDAAPAPAFVLAAVDGTSTWIRLDDGTVLA